MLDFPLNNQEKGSIENAQFGELKSLKFKGGLPVFTAVPTYTGSEGEIVWVNDGTYYSLYAYINGGWRQLSSTDLTDGGATALHSHASNAKYSGENIFNGAAPDDYADLDLSSYVGANRALIYLTAILTGGSGNAGIFFRTNGATVKQADSTDITTRGASEIWVAKHDPSFFASAWVMTDENGIIEWFANPTDAAVYLTLKAYIILS